MRKSKVMEELLRRSVSITLIFRIPPAIALKSCESVNNGPFHIKQSKMKSNEFEITGVAEGDSADAALHEPLLANKDAAAMSELMAVDALIKIGISVEEAANACAGPETRARLIDSGLLKE